MSTYKQITELIELAVFHYQSKDVSEVINFIRANSNLRSLDEKEIERLINVICTPYKDSPEDIFIPKNA